jgi:hypothetical protein
MSIQSQVGSAPLYPYNFSIFLHITMVTELCISLTVYPADHLYIERTNGPTSDQGYHDGNYVYTHILP